MGRARIAVAAAMLATPIGIGRELHGNVRAVVAADHALGAVVPKLRDRIGAEFFFKTSAVEIRVAFELDGQEAIAWIVGSTSAEGHSRILRAGRRLPWGKRAAWQVKD